MTTPDDLLKYLRYLRGRIDTLATATQLGIQEIAPLQGELRLFRERVLSLKFATGELKDYLGSVRLEIAASRLEGTKEHFRATWWLHLPFLKFFRASRTQKDREIIEAELSHLRASIYDLYCLVEVTYKLPNQLAQPPQRTGG